MSLKARTSDIIAIVINERVIYKCRDSNQEKKQRSDTKKGAKKIKSDNLT